MNKNKHCQGHSEQPSSIGPEVIPPVFCFQIQLGSLDGKENVQNASPSTIVRLKSKPWHFSPLHKLCSFNYLSSKYGVSYTLLLVPCLLDEKHPQFLILFNPQTVPVLLLRWKYPCRQNLNAGCNPGLQSWVTVIQAELRWHRKTSLYFNIKTRQLLNFEYHKTHKENKQWFTGLFLLSIPSSFWIILPSPFCLRSLRAKAFFIKLLASTKLCQTLHQIWK